MTDNTQQFVPHQNMQQGVLHRSNKKCNFGANCRNLLTGSCPFIHSSEDIEQAKLTKINTVVDVSKDKINKQVNDTQQKMTDKNIQELLISQVPINNSSKTELKNESKTSKVKKSQSGLSTKDKLKTLLSELETKYANTELFQLCDDDIPFLKLWKILMCYKF